MANTSITLTTEQGALVPSQPSVAVNEGDTVTFTAAGSAFIFFSPGAAAILSPLPSSPVDISSGSAEFTFATSSPGAYSVYFETTAGATIPEFPIAPSNLLLLQIDADPIYSVIEDRTKG
jgi:plastocyanin